MSIAFARFLLTFEQECDKLAGQQSGSGASLHLTLERLQWIYIAIH